MATAISGSALWVDGAERDISTYTRGDLFTAIGAPSGGDVYVAVKDLVSTDGYVNLGRWPNGELSWQGRIKAWARITDWSQVAEGLAFMATTDPV